MCVGNTNRIAVELLWRERGEVMTPVDLMHLAHKVLVREPMPRVKENDDDKVEAKLRR